MVHKKVGTFTTMVSVGTQCCDRQSSTGPEMRDVAVNTEEMAGFDDSTAYVPSRVSQRVRLIPSKMLIFLSTTTKMHHLRRLVMKLMTRS